MKPLYHGTLRSLVPSILKDGLRPRGESKSHDEYLEQASMPHFVYLTSSYGMAINHAARISERTADGAPISVIEIDSKSLKRKLRYPDEDYLVHEWNSDFLRWTLDEQLKFMEYHRDTWSESLSMMKTVAYKGVIPAKSLTFVRVSRWLEQEHRARFLKPEEILR